LKFYWIVVKIFPENS